MRTFQWVKWSVQGASECPDTEVQARNSIKRRNVSPSLQRYKEKKSGTLHGSRATAAQQQHNSSTAATHQHSSTTAAPQQQQYSNSIAAAKCSIS
jgi:hypothetical protein